MDFEQLLADTHLTTRQTAEKYRETFIQNGYMDYIQKRTIQEIEILKSKYPQVENHSKFMREQLSEYLSILVSKIKEEYGSSIPVERIQLLEGLLEPSNVVVLDDETGKHDFSANTETGQVIVNLARMRGDDIYQKVINAKGILPHETFHLVIQMLKNRELADDRMIIDLVDGEQIRSRGMVGFMLNEGLVEKYSTEFCARNNFYSTIALQYIPYVNISNYILVKEPSLSTTVFSTDFEDMLNHLTEQERQAYLSAECVSYAVRHKDINPGQITNVKIEKVPLENVAPLDFTQGLNKEQLMQIKEQLGQMQQPMTGEEAYDAPSGPKF